MNYKVIEAIIEESTRVKTRLNSYTGNEQEYFGNWLTEEEIKIAKSCGKQYFMWITHVKGLEEVKTNPVLRKVMEDIGFIIIRDQIIFFNEEDYKKLGIYEELQ